jgi:chemotaxis response regulator CheB
VRNARIQREADPLVVIGSSAGGPAALQTILGGLQQDFSAAIIVVQHIDKLFDVQLANWLNDSCALPVRLAEERDRPQKGTVLLARGYDHLVFRDSHTLGYSATPSHGVYRPSIDVFFDSAMHHWKGRIAGVLLTGMGRDGAKALKSLRASGAFTIAQDHATSSVYGMPKAAAELGAAMEILPLDRISPALAQFARRQTRQ